MKTPERALPQIQNNPSKEFHIITLKGGWRAYVLWGIKLANLKFLWMVWPCLFSPVGEVWRNLDDNSMRKPLDGKTQN